MVYSSYLECSFRKGFKCFNLNIIPLCGVKFVSKRTNKKEKKFVTFSKTSVLQMRFIGEVVDNVQVLN